MGGGNFGFKIGGCVENWNLRKVAWMLGGDLIKILVKSVNLKFIKN